MLEDIKQKTVEQSTGTWINDSRRSLVTIIQKAKTNLIPVEKIWARFSVPVPCSTFAIKINFGKTSKPDNSSVWLRQNKINVRIIVLKVSHEGSFKQRVHGYNCKLEVAKAMEVIPDAKQINKWWMDELRFYVLFNSISCISGQWTGDNKRSCAMEPRLRLKRSPQRVSSYPGTLYKWLHSEK